MVFWLFLTNVPFLAMEKPGKSGGVPTKKQRIDYERYGYRRIDGTDGTTFTIVRLRRDTDQIQQLMRWGFTKSDISNLTITNIDSPINDERIRRAIEERHIRSRTGFALLASEILWPTVPCEPDLLLLIPYLTALDHEGINNELRGTTPLEMCVYLGYHRAVQLLLTYSHINVNGRVGEERNPLETAFELIDIRMAALLLSDSRVEITQRARDRAEQSQTLRRMLRAFDNARSSQQPVSVQLLAHESGAADLLHSIPSFSPVLINHDDLNVYTHERRYENLYSDDESEAQEEPAVENGARRLAVRPVLHSSPLSQ